MKGRRCTITRAYPALQRSIERRVRFEEVDALRYMWHGRYASWLEDGREDLGNYYGIGYLDFYNHGIAIPLKTFALDFKAPLRYGIVYTIRTSLLWNEAAVLEYSYSIHDSDEQIMCTAVTKQLMLSIEGQLLLDFPQFYKEFCQQWQQGLIA